MKCVDCKSELNVSYDETVECQNCGLINEVLASDEKKPPKGLNCLLIKNRLKMILESEFQYISDDLKNEIITYSPKVGRHMNNTLTSFILLYLEYKNELKEISSFIVKKKQRKNVLKILLEINRPIIFVKTPITFMSLYNLESEEKEMFKRITYCLMYLNMCAKKNIHEISQKIYDIIIAVRNKTKLLETKRPSKSNIDYFIKTIIAYDLSPDDFTN